MVQDNIPPAAAAAPSQWDTADELATIWAAYTPVSELATQAENAYKIAYLASVFNSGNLTNAKKALVFNEAGFTVPNKALVFNEAGFTVPNKALVFDNANLTAANANSICDHANLASDNEQAILYQMITSHYFDKLIDIITDGQSDVTISSNTQIEDTTIYKDLTVDAGYTLTLHTASDSKSGILIARTITNNGTITRTAQGAAGGSGGVAGAGDGVKGGAGLLIIVKTIDNNSLISAPGLAGIAGTTIAAIGPGGNGANGALYRVSTDIVGAGGHGGNSSGGPSHGGGGGSNAGAGYPAGLSNRGGDAGAATYTTLTGAQIHDLLLQATVDYFIETLESKAAPSAPETFPDVCNSGSGEGGAYDTTDAAGGGGGGGGEVIIVCDTYDNIGGTISANGGNGGNGGTEGIRDAGGGGGGGGIVYVLYKTQTNAGTLSATGGAKGTTDNPNPDATDGAAGTTSVIDVTV